MVNSVLSIATLGLLATVSHALSPRPLGCDTKLNIVSITSAQTYSGNLTWLTDGVTRNPYQQPASTDWPWNLDIELDTAYPVCALSYHCAWWLQVPSGGSISFSNDGGATYTNKANFTGSNVGVHIGFRPTPEYMNTFALDGSGADHVRLTITGAKVGEARVREVSVYTYD